MKMTFLGLTSFCGCTEVKAGLLYVKKHVKLIGEIIFLAKICKNFHFTSNDEKTGNHNT